MMLFVAYAVASPYPITKAKVWRENLHERVAPFSWKAGGADHSLFGGSVLLTDSSGHYWTNLLNGPRPLLIRGDTIAWVHRGVPATENLVVWWSFDGGNTWHYRDNVEEGITGGSGFGWYPQLAGFTSDGKVVVVYPDPAPGSNAVCAVEVVESGTLEGACESSVPHDDYAQYAWQIGPDQFAILSSSYRFSDTASLYYLVYDASTNSFSTPQAIRDGAAQEDFTIIEAHLFGDSVLVVGSSDNATAVWGEPSGYGYIWVRNDGTTNPDAPSISGDMFYGDLSSQFILTIGGTEYYPFGYTNVQYHTAVSPDGSVWIAYPSNDTSITGWSWEDLGGWLEQSSHIIVTNKSPFTTGIIPFFYPDDGSGGVNTNRTLTWPVVFFGSTPDTMAVVWIQYEENTPPACSPDPASLTTFDFTSVLAFAKSTDGGYTWCTDTIHVEGGYFGFPVAPVVGKFANRLVNDSAYIVYVTPMAASGAKDPFCHLMHRFQGGTEPYYAVDVKLFKFSTSCSGDPTGISADVILDVAERPAQLPDRVVVEVVKGGVKVSGAASVYDIRGSLVAETEGGFVALKRGVYFVKTANGATKVVVR